MGQCPQWSPQGYLYILPINYTENLNLNYTNDKTNEKEWKTLRIVVFLSWTKICYPKNNNKEKRKSNNKSNYYYYIYLYYINRPVQ